MNRNKLILICAIAVASTTMNAAPPQQSAPAQQPPPAAMPGPGSPGAGGTTPSVKPPTRMDCSQLPPAEQRFAEQMTTVENQRMFCQEMTPATRKEVMSMTKPMRPSDPKFSPDQAMDMYRTKQNASKQQTPASGEKKAWQCPVE